MSRAHVLVARLTRVGAYALVVGLALLGFLVGEGRARAKELSLAVGEKVLDAPLEPDGSVHRIFLGDQEVSMAAVQTSLSVDAVLARARAMCESSANGMGAALAHAETTFAPQAEPIPADVPGAGVLADVRGARGAVACFATGDPVSVGDLSERLATFGRTHDFADLGRLRHVAARKTDTGATLVVATWIEGGFALDRLFPARGDAAGDDPRIAPRPADARRLLSAHDASTPHGVYLYEIADANGDALDRYAALARASGLASVATASPTSSRSFVAGDVDVVVALTRNEGSSATLSIVEMRGRK